MLFNIFINLQNIVLLYHKTKIMYFNRENEAVTGQ